jgi:hypothetical protein
MGALDTLKSLPVERLRIQLDCTTSLIWRAGWARGTHPSSILNSGWAWGVPRGVLQSAPRSLQWDCAYYIRLGAGEKRKLASHVPVVVLAGPSFCFAARSGRRISSCRSASPTEQSGHGLWGLNGQARSILRRASHQRKKFRIPLQRDSAGKPVSLRIRHVAGETSLKFSRSPDPAMQQKMTPYWDRSALSDDTSQGV